VVGDESKHPLTHLVVRRSHGEHTPKSIDWIGALLRARNAGALWRHLDLHHTSVVWPNNMLSMWMIKARDSLPYLQHLSLAVEWATSTLELLFDACPRLRVLKLRVVIMGHWTSKDWAQLIERVVQNTSRETLDEFSLRVLRHDEAKTIAYGSIGAGPYFFSCRWCTADDWNTFETLMLQAPRVVRIEWPNMPVEFDTVWQQMLVAKSATLRRLQVSGGVRDARAFFRDLLQAARRKTSWPHLQALRLGPVVADAQALDGAVDLLRHLPRMEHLLVAPDDWDDAWLMTLPNVQPHLRRVDARPRSWRVSTWQPLVQWLNATPSMRHVNIEGQASSAKPWPLSWLLDLQWPLSHLALPVQACDLKDTTLMSQPDFDSRRRYEWQRRLHEQTKVRDELRKLGDTPRLREAEQKRQQIELSLHEKQAIGYFDMAVQASEGRASSPAAGAPWLDELPEHVSSMFVDWLFRRGLWNAHDAMPYLWWADAYTIAHGVAPLKPRIVHTQQWEEAQREALRRDDVDTFAFCHDPKTELLEKWLVDACKDQATRCLRWMSLHKSVTRETWTQVAWQMSIQSKSYHAFSDVLHQAMMATSDTPEFARRCLPTIDSQGFFIIGNVMRECTTDTGLRRALMQLHACHGDARLLHVTVDEKKRVARLTPSERKTMVQRLREDILPKLQNAESRDAYVRECVQASKKRQLQEANLVSTANFMSETSLHTEVFEFDPLLVLHISYPDFKDLPDSASTSFFAACDWQSLLTSMWAPLVERGPHDPANFQLVFGKHPHTKYHAWGDKERFLFESNLLRVKNELQLGKVASLLSISRYLEDRSHRVHVELKPVEAAALGPADQLNQYLAEAHGSLPLGLLLRREQNERLDPETGESLDAKELSTLLARHEVLGDHLFEDDLFQEPMLQNLYRYLIMWLESQQFPRALMKYIGDVVLEWMRTPAERLDVQLATVQLDQKDSKTGQVRTCGGLRAPGACALLRRFSHSFFLCRCNRMRWRLSSQPRRQ
jgi:hypothetical protein